jgi:hypothetical protein
MGDSHESREIARVVASQVTPEVSRFMGTVIGSPSIELSEMAAEQVRAWRFRREIKFAKRAMKQLADAGMDPTAVPMRTLAPLLEGATLEDDDAMSERWAALLANAAGRARDVPPSFPSVLRDLEPIEARILDHAYEALMQIAPEVRATQLFGIFRNDVVAALGLSDDRYTYHADNLIRLRLLRQPPGPVVQHVDLLILSEFGRAFVRACRPPSQPDPLIVVTSPGESAT